MNTLLKSAGGITQVSADSRLLSNFDKVMEEAAASRPEYCIEKYWNTFRENPDRTARCIYTSLNTAMDKCSHPGSAK